MKPKLKLQRLLPWAAMLVLFTMFSITTAKAQCPDPSWTPHAPFTITIPGTNCDITIYYCQRPGGEYYIWKVVATPGPDCATIPPERIVYWADSLIYYDDNVNGLLPCEKGVTKRVIISRAACWSLDPMDPSHLSVIGCLQGATCSKTCYVCGFDQGVQLRDCSSELVGLPSGCYELGADGPTWVVGHCYILNCGQTQ
jgi:hypothetical protein